MIQNLLKVKSIVTILITLTFVVAAFLGKITGEQLLNIYTVIIAFYFGTQAGKNEQ